jgi:hypothetical protein
VKIGAQQPRPLLDSELPNFILSFSSGTFAFNLKFSESIGETQGNKIFWQNTVFYQRPQQSSSWVPYCNDDSGRAAFLKDRTVSGVTGIMNSTQTLGQLKVTMACVSGAISGCMGWGYRPWEAAAADQTRANKLYAACVQAKRAAYYVQSGDYNSYTVRGTPLSVQDNSGVMAHSSMPGLEAIWTSNGASCFMPEDRRIAATTENPLPPLPNIQLPRCTADQRTRAINGTLWQVLTDDEPFATGPASP